MPLLHNWIMPAPSKRVTTGSSPVKGTTKNRFKGE